MFICVHLRLAPVLRFVPLCEILFAVSCPFAVPFLDRHAGRSFTTIIRMKSSFRILLLLVASALACFAGEIQKGATAQVKADSIWFQKAADLSHWQQLKKAGNSKGFEGYQEKELSDRDAWQFGNQLTVKIISYDGAKNQVHVKMLTPGRMLGTDWFLDAGALVK